MIFQDLIKNYGRAITSPRCAIKIDLSKAYDTVDWQFLEDLLKALYFPMKFIGWIMMCLRNTSYSLLMNGRVQGKFKGKKGLRQGDPMSPLLFVLIMEYLTRRLQLVALDPSFRFHPMCKSLKLVNLCFADDLIIFCKGTQSAVFSLKIALDEFSLATSLTINSAKSQIFFGGVSSTVRNVIS
ncbi:secreted RxLR effector protein 78-like [Humulus lupulus]|uniref:secreted RxLR effector protein 78-like n=1 Tax=Humulus lupulus TaxID=3486 RepID=UPI002B404741|nr:secreted RxLR effector protein 78-like [Humulus lupulus]